MGPRVISKNQHFDFNRDTLYGDERFRFLLIKDDRECKGFRVFKALLNKYCESDVNVRLINMDGPVEDIVFGVKINSDKLFVNDEFECCATTLLQTKKTFYEKYFEDLNSFEGILIIYSLTTLLIQESTSKVYQALHSIMKNNPKIHIITLLHCDVHSCSEVQIIESLATAVIEVGKDKFLLTMSTKNKSYGLTAYNFLISEFSFASVSISMLQSNKKPVKKLDPTANLTFDLNLNEKEKADREQLELPYTKLPIEESIVSQDLEDFYEEDDPDDDLIFLESV